MISHSDSEHTKASSLQQKHFTDSSFVLSKLNLLKMVSDIFLISILNFILMRYNMIMTYRIEAESIFRSRAIRLEKDKSIYFVNRCDIL